MLLLFQSIRCVCFAGIIVNNSSLPRQLLSGFFLIQHLLLLFETKSNILFSQLKEVKGFDKGLASITKEHKKIPLSFLSDLLKTFHGWQGGHFT